jgi:carbon storage regulator
MLVLSRKSGEKVLLGGEITITLLEIQGNRVRIGIEAPGQVAVLRAELSRPAPRVKGAGLPSGGGESVSRG